MSTVNGMEITNISDDLTKKVLYNSDIVFHITEQLCMRPFPQYIRRDIRALSDTNKFFHDYYSTENNKQAIIRIVVACNNYYSDEAASQLLCCRTINKKIDYFREIAHNPEKEFTQEDLKEKWYLNVITYCDKSLLYRVIEDEHFEKAQLIIKHSGLDLSFDQLLRVENFIFCKILLRSRKENKEKNENKEELDKLYSIRDELQKIILVRKKKSIIIQ